MIIKNAKVYSDGCRFVEKDLIIRDGRIVFGAAPLEGEDVIDAGGAYALPGLVDIHFHGAVGHDFCDADAAGLQAIADFEASKGVLAICPATMTFSEEILNGIMDVAAAHKNEHGADLVGINMEGPFISPVKKGAQDDRNILPCDIALCERFLEASEDLVKFVGIAPEESENSLEFIRHMKEKVDISLAHTNADYDTAMAAFSAGANHAVHLYNGMPEILHRAPGVVGAVFDSKHVMTEIICDGIHIHPASVRATFQMMGADRMILISDSMRATGMPDGQYTLGGLDVKVVGKLATLVSDGAIAGSATNLADCMRTAVQKMNLPLETAIACATINPARSLKIDKDYGSLEKGKKANVVLLGKDLELKCVIKDGKRI